MHYVQPIQIFPSLGSTPETWTRVLDSPNVGDVTFNGSAGSVLIVPKPLVSQSLLDADADSSVNLIEGGGANGGDRLEFIIDGVVIGGAEVLAGGIVKWDFAGILDPVIYRPTPQTTAQLTALIPSAVLGDIAFDSTLAYHVKFDGAAWVEMSPVSIVDLNTTVSDETGANGIGLTTPTTPASATPDIGDTHIEIYDDVNIYFTATATNWTTPTVVQIARDILNLASAITASNDAAGNGGVASTAARSDHKHAAQGVSADANNANIVGTDGLHQTLVAQDANVIANTAKAMLDATRVIDEDNMVSDSNVKVPTQQSVKAFVAASQYMLGLYSSTAAYKLNDVVLYNSRLYIAIQARGVGVWTTPPSVTQFKQLSGAVRGNFDPAVSYQVGDVLYDSGTNLGAFTGIYKVDVAFVGGSTPDRDNFTEVGVRSRYRGDFGLGIYKVGDVVQSGGKLYRCITQHGSNGFGAPFSAVAGNFTELGVPVLQFSAAFSTGSWTVGTPNTITITASAHGLGVGHHTTTVLDSANDVVGIEINLNDVTGDVTIKTSGAVFAGTIIIKK
jgi:hypothetical protein